MTTGEALTRNAERLHEAVKEHRRLLELALRSREARGHVEVSFSVECVHRKRLRETLAEVIEILEETRKSFKSRRLEALRKKLIGVLAEDA